MIGKKILDRFEGQRIKKIEVATEKHFDCDGEFVDEVIINMKMETESGNIISINAEAEKDVNQPEEILTWLEVMKHEK